MSILIKGMEMPKDGEMLCINIYPGGKVCINLDLECSQIATAAPVPPHGRLIDADKLVELCDIMADKCDGIGASIWHQFKTTVEWSPIVIPAEKGEE